MIISGSEDRTIRIWDMDTGTEIGDPFTGHGGAVTSIAAAELDSRPVIISGSEDRTIADLGPC